jgi:hypothetical protein
VSNDLSHDPHLRAALRHAPDHALVPPAGVSQTILNAARQVHKPARPAATPAPAVRITVARPRALARLHQWFASPRLAGGLATGLVAALGLGLWIDLGREPVIDRAPVRSAQELRSSDATPVAPAIEPGGAAADAAREVQPAPAAPTARPETPRARRAERAAEAKVERRNDAPPAVRQAPASPTPAPERHEDSVAHEAEPALAQSAPPAAALPAPAAEPAPAEPLAAQGPATQAAGDAPQRAEATKSDQRMSLAAGRAVAGARASALESGSAADAVAAASPAFTLLRRARGEEAASSARWSWKPPGSPMMGAFDDAGQAWLARVVQATRGRWTDATDRIGLGDAVEARWWRDDWPQATLRIEADGVRWIEHNGRIRYAPLDAATLQRLRSL